MHHGVKSALRNVYMLTRHVGEKKKEESTYAFAS